MSWQKTKVEVDKEKVKSEFEIICREFNEVAENGAIESFAFLLHSDPLFIA